MKTPTTKFLATSIAGAFLASIPAHAALWDGGAADGLWETALNWDDDAAPNGTADINNGDTVTRGVDSTVSRTFVNDGSTLNVTGGNQSDNQSGNTTRNFVGSSGAGTVNQSGGDYNIGHLLAIGGNGTGIYNLTGGVLNVSRGSNTLAGNPNTFGGNSGGSISVGYGSGSGLLDITGGSVITRIGVEVGSNGTFQIQGDAATTIGIGSSGSLDGHWWQASGGVLSMGIATTGVTPIFIDDTDQATANPYARFEAGAVLNLSFFGTSPFAGTWTLMEAENTMIDDQGLILSAATLADPNWSFAVDNTGSNGLLTATYVPEPSVALLGALGLLGLGIRRRRH